MSYAESPVKVPAIARTWEAYHVDRECGVVVGIVTYSVTLSKETGELIATVDGKVVPVAQATCILKGATRLTLTREIIPTPAYLRELGVSA